MKQYSKKIMNNMIICLSITLAACNEKTSTTNNGSPNVNHPISINDSTPIEQKVTTQELTKDYSHNKKLADDKYKGKIIELIGTIKKIEMGISDLPEVILETENTSNTKQPRLEFGDSQSNQTEKLEQGQEINVTCRGNGEVAGMPLLSECIIK